MTDDWQVNDTASAQIVDDDDVPEDWEAHLNEKPEKAQEEEKPKASSATTKSKTSKKKTTDEGSKILDKQSDSDSKLEGDALQNKIDATNESVDKNSENQSLDNINLFTREEFLDYSLRLTNRLEPLSKSEYYSEFLDHFLTGITSAMSIESVKHLHTTLQVAQLRKQSDEREKKAKSKAKKQTKPQLKTGRQADYTAFGGDEEHDYDQDFDYDDDDF